MCINYRIQRTSIGGALIALCLFVIVFSGCGDLAPPSDLTPPNAGVIMANLESGVGQLAFDVVNVNAEAVRVLVVVAFAIDERDEPNSAVDGIVCTVSNERFDFDTGFVLPPSGAADARVRVVVSNLLPRAYSVTLITQDMAGNAHPSPEERTAAPLSVADTRADVAVSISGVDVRGLEVEGQFQLVTTIRNVGRLVFGRSALTYYALQNDGIASEQDEDVGMREVRAIPTNESDEYSMTLTAPATPGIYYYSACVARVDGATGTRDHCSLPLAIYVEAPSPDLSLTSLVVSPLTANAGDDIILHAVVTNNSLAPSSEYAIVYYSSVTPTPPSSVSDYRVLQRASFDALSAKGSSYYSYIYDTGHIPYHSDAQSVHFLACIFTDVDRDPENNCTDPVVSVSVITTPVFDLGIREVSSSPSTVSAEVPFAFSAIVENVGTLTSPSSDIRIRYYRSLDRDITTSDTEVGVDTVAAIEGGGTENHTISLTSPATPGGYYYGACVDVGPGAEEFNTTNNCSDAYAVTVIPITPPDLIVSASISTATVRRARQFTIRATIENTGGSDAPPTTVLYVLSADASITLDDEVIMTGHNPTRARAYIGAVGAGGHVDRYPLTLRAGEIGTYYYGVCVTPVETETMRDNNCSAGLPLTVADARLEINVRASLLGIEYDDVITVQNKNEGQAEIENEIVFSVTIHNTGTAPTEDFSVFHSIGTTSAGVSLSDEEKSVLSHQENIATPIAPGAVHEYTFARTIPAFRTIIRLFPLPSRLIRLGYSPGVYTYQSIVGPYHLYDSMTIKISEGR